MLSEKRKEETTTTEIRNRLDSGCFSTPCRTPLLAQSRRESVHNSETNTPTVPLSTPEEEQGSSSPEDRSEATSHSTVKRAGGTERSSLTSPDSQLLEETVEDTFKKVDTDRDDSGQSSSSTQGQITTSTPKRLCTCHHLNSNSVKCRHCLLEASEALRKLFDKYSLSINSKNHIDYTARYQNLLNSQNKTPGLDKSSNKDGDDVSKFLKYIKSENKCLTLHIRITFEKKCMYLINISFMMQHKG